MTTFPSDIKFCFSWRKYQKRVLDELEAYLDDDRLHVIAPPGSGKTVLGLEVVRRLDRPTLILSPTITIRNQWVERFTSLFLNSPDNVPGWISKDMKNPAIFTVGTYQALHSIYSGKKDGKSDAKKTKNPFGVFKKARIGTIVVDEAHHLKNEWWKSLTALRKSLREAKVVALTATPPYDVPRAEWERYQELCGAVDTQISVPELIIEKNLAPHQDYVYFSHPPEEEYSPIKKFRDDVDTFMDDILLDIDFATPIEEHVWMREPETHMEDIFSNVEFFSSMLIFLKAVERWIWDEALMLLDVEKKAIPPLDLEWMEILLTNIIFTDTENFISIKEKVKQIKRRLGRMGAIERKKVVLRNTRNIKKTLTKSIGKLKAIVEIVKAESEALKTHLRMVILTDYIYLSDMPNYIDDIAPINRIGVVPVFERLRREYLWDIRIGILSGSLVVIPGEAITDFKLTAADLDVDIHAFSFSPLGHDPGYQIVEASGKSKEKLVTIITRLFTIGAINLIVGTKSLLGEGWDAPCINSMIMASFVGSWVLSNQMRGRALRINPDNPEKAANIWHLASVEPGQKEVSDDFNSLIRRFRAFVGVSFDGERIESGIGRLDIPPPSYDKNKIESVNSGMILKAADRQGLINDWESALKHGWENMGMVEHIRALREFVPSGIVIRNTMVSFIREGILMCGFGFFYLLSNIQNMSFLSYPAIILGFGGVISLPQFLKLVWINFKYGPDMYLVKEAGEIIIKSLAQAGFIKTGIKSLKVVTQKREDDKITCHLEGGSNYEKSLFLDAVSEMFEPVQNPRYLIVKRKARLGLKRNIYYPVPKLIAKNKKNSVYFYNLWRKTLGKAELIYTRTVEGRKELVKARIASAGLKGKSCTERVSMWK